jgi:hypothetical protein
MIVLRDFKLGFFFTDYRPKIFLQRKENRRYFCISICHDAAVASTSLSHYSVGSVKPFCRSPVSSFMPHSQSSAMLLTLLSHDSAMSLTWPSLKIGNPPRSGLSNHLLAPPMPRFVTTHAATPVVPSEGVLRPVGQLVESSGT